MKKPLVFILLLFSILTYSQRVIGKVVYKAAVETTEEYKKQKTTTKHDQFFEAVDEQGKKFNLELSFSKQNSLYQLKEPMHKNSHNEYVYNMAKILFKVGKKFYTSIKDNTIIKETTFSGEKYLIESSYDTSDWKMLNKQEKIGKYNCYIAERDFTFESRKGPTTIKQTVWYTPEIAFPFGPANFVGFPGLVLKVKTGNIVYSAKSIELNPSKEENLVMKLEGKKITKEAFDNLVKEASLNFNLRKR